MKNERGVSLVESLLIIFTVSFIVLLLANLPNSMSLINKSKHLSLAREIASKQIEDKRAINYANLADGTLEITPAVDSRISSLPNSGGTVVVEPCDEVNICTNAERIKLVTVTVNWTENGKAQKITLKTFIGEGGLNQ